MKNKFTIATTYVVICFIIAMLVSLIPTYYPKLFYYNCIDECYHNGIRYVGTHNHWTSTHYLMFVMGILCGIVNLFRVITILSVE